MKFVTMIRQYFAIVENATLSKNL